jgi:hypothetical protein
MARYFLENKRKANIFNRFKNFWCKCEWGKVVCGILCKYTFCYMGSVSKFTYHTFFYCNFVLLFSFFRLFRNKPKETEKIIFWFRETNRKLAKTDCVSVCFGSNRNFFYLFRGHPRVAVHGVLIY